MTNIRPELSAQGYSAQPNPMLSRFYAYAKKAQWEMTRAADQGCGRLRHLGLMAQHHDYLVLVDTQAQMSHCQLLAGRRITIPDFVEEWNEAGHSCCLAAMVAEEYAMTELDLDVVFSIATFDVVTRKTRHDMAESAARNLKKSGLYVVIAPRNDSSILQRCTPSCAYEDGHVFSRPAGQTFYCNFRKTDDIIDLVTAVGFVLEKDFSVYRQVALCFRRA